MFAVEFRRDDSVAYWYVDESSAFNDRQIVDTIRGRMRDPLWTFVPQVGDVVVVSPFPSSPRAGTYHVQTPGRSVHFEWQSHGMRRIAAVS